MFGGVSEKQNRAGPSGPYRRAMATTWDNLWIEEGANSPQPLEFILPIWPLAEDEEGECEQRNAAVEVGPKSWGRSRSALVEVCSLLYSKCC